MLQRVLCPGVFICFLKAGILGEVSGEDLNRIFISLIALIHQNEHMEGSGSFSGQLHLCLGFVWL